MIFQFERTPKGAVEHRLHLVAGQPTQAPLRQHEAVIDETGTLVFSMLSLEQEDRS